MSTVQPRPSARQQLGIDFRAIESPIGLNWYDADPNLQMLVERLCAPEDRAFVEEQLRRMGGVIGGPVAERAEITDKHPPRLERYDRWGNEANTVVHHESALATKRDLWENGFLGLRWTDEVRKTKAGRLPPVVNTGFLYFLNQAETGMACGIGMTSSAAGIINKYAPPELRERFLPHLTTMDYAEAWDGGMFMTEIRGGSDLAASECSASKASDGSWRLNGAKWFCSNLDAEAILVLARPEGAALGLASLVMFLVPQLRADGGRNGMHIRRLKDKLGTKAVPTGEVDFIDAEAYLMARENPPSPRKMEGGLGAEARGINRMMEMVQSSRFGVSLMGLGIMRRSFLEAACYAHHREAFGQLLIDFPLVRETLVNMAVEVEAGCALAFEAAEAGANREDDGRLYRILVPLAKYRCARRGLDLATQAVEMHGGNGYIENWPVARQFRDAMCHPIWEGTENIICLDVLRAMAKDHADEALFARIERALGGAEHPALADAVSAVGGAVNELKEAIVYLQRAPEDERLLNARRLTDFMADVTQAALLTEEAVWELANKNSARKAVVARQFIESHLTQHAMRGIASPNRIPLDFFDEIVSHAPISPAKLR
jgi:alkylation response protein AidB-like acyl-CoA dehydrogenase